MSYASSAGSHRLTSGQDVRRGVEVTAVPLALAGELAAEFGPPAVADRAGQVPVADHARDVQVLDHDDVVLADQPDAGPVLEVPARVTDRTVGTRHLRGGLGSGSPAAAAPRSFWFSGVLRRTFRVSQVPVEESLEARAVSNYHLSREVAEHPLGE